MNANARKTRRKHTSHGRRGRWCCKRVLVWQRRAQVCEASGSAHKIVFGSGGNFQAWDSLPASTVQKNLHARFFVFATMSRSPADRWQCRRVSLAQHGFPSRRLPSERQRARAPPLSSHASNRAVASPASRCAGRWPCTVVIMYAFTHAIARLID